MDVTIQRRGKLCFLNCGHPTLVHSLLAGGTLTIFMKQQKISSIIRLDRGTETGVLASMHAFLRRSYGDMAPGDIVQYGTSKTNRIERWWTELSLERYVC